MQVKTLKPHRNMHGIHAVGDKYEHNRPAADLKFGYVEKVQPTVDDLKTEAEERNIALPTTGSGKNGGVIKADIVEAIEAAG